jgi:hypothetical protein
MDPSARVYVNFAGFQTQHFRTPKESGYEIKNSSVVPRRYHRVFSIDI